MATIDADIDELTFQRAVAQVKRIEQRGATEALLRFRSATVYGVQLADFDHNRGELRNAAQLIQYLITLGLDIDLEVVAACLAGYYQRRNWWLALGQSGN